MLVLTGNGRSTARALENSGAPLEIFDDLAAAVSFLVAEAGQGAEQTR